MRRLTTARSTPTMARSARGGMRTSRFDPHIRGARTQRGSDLMGIRKANELAQARSGKGFFAKVPQKITPVRLGGGAAAMRMAMGPENDSPSNTKGRSLGKALRTRASSSS
jgi:hypothetical protein